MSGFSALLVFVAWLGQHGLEEEIYGQPLPLAQVEGGASEKDVAETGKSETLSGEHDHDHASEALLGQSGAASSPRPPADKPASSLPAPCGKDAAPRPVGITPDGLVILNVASAQDLTTLTGVGPARAEAILALRERLGGFRKIADLLRVKGIGWKTLETLKKKVVLDPPRDPSTILPADPSEKTPSEKAPGEGAKPPPVRDTTPRAAVQATSPWDASPTATNRAPYFTALPEGTDLPQVTNLPQGAVAARSSAP